jgi:predicted butyrate kinase (DUF1464 family)
MALSIGVDCSRGQWRISLRENGLTLQLSSFIDGTSALAYLERTCALYPEPTIVLSTDLNMPLTRLSMLTEQQLNELTAHLIQQRYFLYAIRIMSLDSYCLPSFKYLASVPIHRKLGYLNMGAPGDLSVVTTLLYRMREREAAWSEMSFFLLEIGYRSRRIVVVEEGRIVNGIVGVAAGDLTYLPDGAEYFSDETARGDAADRAFWESLTRELAGLMAVHHLEDIIIMGPRKDAFIERFSDTYQVYHYPQGEPDSEGYEAAIGAGIIAEGLRYPGLAAEVVERLQICSLS